ncbi:MAG: hypothetical protein GC171_13400 [Terrimonas sp.]|nr:hypothetical protein [Terrimonas sp.]
MNIQEYISSGIIESYVLGLASAEEKNEFEQFCRQYPEIREAREAFELLLEKQAMEQAVPPPPDLKQKIWGQINFNAPVGQTAPIGEIPQSPVARMGWLRYAVAACLVLLAGSLYWNLSLQKQNTAIRESLSSVQNDLDAAKNTIAGLEADAKVIQGNNIKMAALKGMPESPQSFATVYWDTTSKDVYLMVNNLPKPASNQQYQLWALLDGQPIDMGLLTITEKPLQLYKMKNARAAQAFAITLEKKGGNPTPEGKMYVMGNL